MNKTGLLIALFFSSGLAFADRPWVSEANTATDGHAAAPAVEHTVEQADSGFVPAPAVAPPATQIQTGTALELQPGETIPVRVLDFPQRGMSMDRVQNELGQPIDISPTVGQPPITTWHYNDRKVFFEYDKVIHTVAIQ